MTKICRPEDLNAHITKVATNVYNGKNKIIVQNRNFIQINNVKECMLTLKSKRCEGFDRIPVCVLADASDILLDPLTQLFEKIYTARLLPEQWKIAKIVIYITFKSLKIKS